MEISEPAVLAKIPLVSVHMLTYNHAPYIAQAIEGVLRQETSFPIELIIGEDCSTDGTREIVFNLQNKYPNVIRVITSEKNVGARKNSQRIGKACRGKYIAFCEGDDFWHHPRKLQIQVDYLEEHLECGLVHSDADKFDVMTGKKSVNCYSLLQKKNNHSSTLIGMILNDPLLCTCTVVVRHDIYRDICRECSYELSDKFLMGDYQTWVEFAYRSKIKYIDKSLATYNLLPESASQSQDVGKNIKFLNNCMDINLHYANKYGGDESKNLKIKIVSRYLSYLSPLVYKTRNPELGSKIIEDSRKYGVPLGPINYLYSISAQNNHSSKIIRFGISSVLRCRRLLAQIKWLRTLRDRLI
jgi:glycosyltransferase involved in cell wall biosynthesis